jgi:pimeloyl-ACP methyl ester carboxylesterase
MEPVSPPLSVLLPGLDGTGDLFARFVTAAPAGFRTQCVRLPSDPALGYAELAEWVRARLPEEPVVLIAESFSGPLGVLLAERCPQVAGLVLCATFVEPPLPRFLARVPKFVWSRPPPIALVSPLMTGGDRVLARELRRAMTGVPADVVAARVRAILSVDVTAELARYGRPLLCLRAKQDRLVFQRSFSRMQALKPSARFVELDGPHLLLQAKPREAWSQIASF